MSGWKLDGHWGIGPRLAAASDRPSSSGTLVQQIASSLSILCGNRRRHKHVSCVPPVVCRYCEAADPYREQGLARTQYTKEEYTIEL